VNKMGLKKGREKGEEMELSEIAQGLCRRYEKNWEGSRKSG